MTTYAHTLAYDGRIVEATQGGTPLSTDRWSIDQQTDVLVGENSEPFFHAGAEALVQLLPRGTHRVLPGQDHSAIWVAPDVVAESISQFVRASTPQR
ncbi:MAG: alpha/beta fold hydrolase [Jiangellaceae bacterium]